MAGLDRVLGEQTQCAGCGRVFRERKRHPCRACGSTNRIIGRTASERLAPADRAS